MQILRKHYLVLNYNLKMSLSPTNILARLEELKKWQQKQQERLLDQHYKRLQPVNSSRDDVLLSSDCSYEQYSPEITEEVTLQPQTISGYIQEGSTIIDDNNAFDDRTNANRKPKQPFLRKGTGLTRFHMTAGEQFKPFPKNGRRRDFNRNVQRNVIKQINEARQMRNPRNKSGEVTTNVSNKKAQFIGNNELSSTQINKEVEDNKENPFKRTSASPLKKPELSIKPKAVWQDVTGRSLVPSVVEAQQEPKPNVNSSDRDLLIFEALEQRAMQSSFCSTNSSIVRLLSSTPGKSSPSKSKTDTQFQAIYARQKKTDDGIMQVSYAQNIRTSAVEEIAEEESACGIIEENPHTLRNIEEVEKKIQHDYLSLIEKALKFKQFVGTDKVSCSSASSVTSEDMETTYESTLKIDGNFNDENKWTDGDAGSSRNSSPAWSNPESNHGVDAAMIESSGWDNRAETVMEAAANDNCDLRLRKRVQELERELKVICAENVKSGKLKAQLDQQQKEFEKYRKEVTKQIEEERVRNNTVLDEEKKKLAKEKMVFERYAKDLQNKPSRKEREEISALKVEIATLKETLKLKETKSGTTQARLRNQIKQLEKDNTILKAEIENLNKQNAKLVASQKIYRKPSDTKMLHEINKNLTRLTQSQLNKHKNKENREQSSSNEDDAGYIEKPALNSNRSGTNLANQRKSNKPELDKENDKNTTNVSGSKTAIEETYEQKFGLNNYAALQQLPSNSFEETKKDRKEEILRDGTKHITYSNGNTKTVSPDGNHIILNYFNGDVKETNLMDGTVRYHYYESKVNHTTNADGTELIEFPDGQTERRLKGGICEVTYSNGIIRKSGKDGTEEISYPDGTSVTINKDGERILVLPNGQKEIHTNKHKRREYPDGTIKILYPDGLQETRYANGRIRVKDKNGKLLMDSHEPPDV